jgi:hypothetical protein
MSQVENNELRGRAAARKLKEKESLTLAEQLIIASNEDKFSFTYKGIEIEVWSPTQNDFSKFLELYNSVLASGEQEPDSEEEKAIFKEKQNAVEKELNKVVADLCVDASIAPEVIGSGMFGTSFIPKLMNELQEYQKREVEEVTAVKGFRKNKSR